ncbi:MAG: peptidoglycan DD-metalloendopeptidase family protein, partial [Xenococcus sp. (in: cyanobacteria)]
PDNVFGKILEPIVGGDRLNLDNFARKRLQNAEVWLKTGIRDFAGQVGLEGLENRYNNRLNNLTFKTQADKKQADFTILTSDIHTKTNQIISSQQKAIQAAKQINKLDVEIAKVQSQRLELLPQDKEGLEASLAAERAIQKQRDELLRVLTQQQQNYRLAINVNKKALEKLEQDYLGQEKNQFYFDRKNLLESDIQELENNLSNLNKIITRLPKALSEFERRLRNTNERVSGFIENRDRVLQQQRTETLTEGLEQGKGEQTIQIEIEQLETKDLELRIAEISREIAKINNDLQSPELAEGVRRVTQSASEQGLELTNVTIARMLEEERDSQEKQALKGLQTLRNLESQLFQFQEQAAQNLQQSRNSLINFNRTINDYFFNLGQRIKEAQLETERLIQQIFYQDIKSQLRRAISPGSESFINGIIDGVQSLLDQAQQIFEQKLGLKSSRLQVESELRSHDQEMRDFIRQVRGASDALLDFRNNLTSGSRRATSVNSDNINSRVPKLGEPQRGRSSVSNAIGFPLPGLTLDSATITSGFGYRNIFGRRDFHEGLDFAATGGTDVLAVRSGVVKHIKPLADQMQVGIESINDAGQTITEWFIHLGQNLNVALGDRVSAGQKIGEVAHTTAYARQQRVSTGDHLDYRARVNGQWVDPKTLLSQASQGTVKFEINKSVNVDTEQKVRSGNEAFAQEKLKGLNLNEIFASYGLKNLETAVAGQKEKIQRQFKLEGLQQENRLADSWDKLADLRERSVLPNADIETARELRQAAAEFRGIKLQGFQDLQRLGDELATIQGVIEVFPSAISKIRESGSEEALATLPVLEQTLLEAQAALPKVQAQLEETSKIQKAIADEEAKQIAFIEEQGKLKKVLELLGRQEELQQLRSNIAAQRGTNEQKRQNQLKAEEIRLEKQIASIKQRYGDSPLANDLIESERRTSQINRDNIDREAYNRDLSYEQELLNLNSGIEGKIAESRRARGFELEANSILRKDARARENLRYQQEISQLEQQYVGEPEKLAELKRAAEELNQVNLASIDQQFKDLGGTIENIAFNEFQNFFSSLVTDVKNIGDLALKMIGNIAKSIGQLFAKQAASKIFGLIFKSAVGFRDGGTVENYEEGGTVSNRIVPTTISDKLQQISAPIRNAFSREGSAGRLAVFTPGEEILSIKTGEAGRYQGLKKEFGVNPLEKIFAGNFLDGGTIEANLLAGLDYKMPTINLAAISSPNRQEPAITKNFYLSSSYQVPDMDSFKASEYQLQQEQLEQFRRMDSRR